MIVRQHVDQIKSFNFDQSPILERDNPDVNFPTSSDHIMNDYKLKVNFEFKTKNVNFRDVFDYIMNDYKLYEKIITNIKEKGYLGMDTQLFFPNDIENDGNLKITIKTMLNNQNIIYLMDLVAIAWLGSNISVNYDPEVTYKFSLFNILKMITINEALNHAFILDNIIGSLQLVYFVYLNLCKENGYSVVVIHEYLEVITALFDIRELSIYDKLYNPCILPTCYTNNKYTITMPIRPSFRDNRYSHILNIDKRIRKEETLAKYNIEATLKLLNPNRSAKDDLEWDENY